MMVQYLKIKEQYKDCILFFRIGDFYEMFFEDAETASRELEIVLTGKDCGLEERAPMCGIPFHAAESYISKLIEKGYKVAICEQMEDPQLAKGLVKRDIIRVVTPGTVLESSMLKEKENNYIACLYIEENYFAVAVCDISTGEFLTTSCSEKYSKVIDELSKYNPKEILIIENKFEEKSKILKILKEKFNLLISEVTDDEKNNDKISKFSSYSRMNEHEITVSGCLYSYIEKNQRISLSNITEIRIYEIKDYMVLDASARRNLEITETIRTNTRKGSLLWLLDKTKTSMGGRMLKKWIEEPLINADEINKRLEAVGELNDNVYVSSDLCEFLKGVYDMERLISRISCNAANARDLVALKESISHLPDIKCCISDCKSYLLKYIYENIETLDDIYDLINKSINDNPPMQLKEGSIIKDSYNPDVDRLRDIMKNGKKYIAELEQKEKDTTGIKSLKVGYNKVFGYYIEVTNSNLSNVPESRYIRKQTLANAERFITPELKELEETITGSEQKLTELEYSLFSDIREKAASNIERVQKTARYVSMLDVLLSFSRVSFENDFIKPVISNDGIIEIKEGRHPVVEKMLQGIFVPNDTYLDLKYDQFAIITGPNMAGKSTYMRQVALIVLMAQIGCFVPAVSAKVSVIDRIFTRIGASDDLSSGKSTFMVEMSEVSEILQNATRNSLIILDEVGRGTSTFDGLSIAWAVVRYITSKIGAKTLFATHYHELTELEGKIEGVKNYCVSVKEHGDDIIFLRKIIRGGADQSYGIQVAKLAGLPDEVVNIAKKILKKLEDSDINKGIKNDEAAADKDDKKSNQLSMFDFKQNELIEEMKNIDINNITPIEALNYLNKLCKKACKMY